nr:uncharacterized protein LOC113804291 [Penaeus vannamei]
MGVCVSSRAAHDDTRRNWSGRGVPPRSYGSDVLSALGDKLPMRGAALDRPRNPYGMRARDSSGNYGDMSGPFHIDYSYGAQDIQAAASSFDAPAAEDPIAALAANIPGGGVPGEDYPILASVPDTGFSCEEQQFPGYYADTAPEAGCQVFHICQFDGRQDAFLCPNGTLFNQQYFVCDWWFNVDCAASAQFRSLNADIGKIPEEDNLNMAYNSPRMQYGFPL